MKCKFHDRLPTAHELLPVLACTPFCILYCYVCINSPCKMIGFKELGNRTAFLYT